MRFNNAGGKEMMQKEEAATATGLKNGNEQKVIDLKKEIGKQTVAPKANTVQ